MSEVAYSVTVPKGKLAEKLLAEEVVGARSKIPNKPPAQPKAKAAFLA